MATIKAYTDLDHSKKLAKILPLESADLYWQDIGGVVIPTFELIGSDMPKDSIVPCWSLAALMNILDRGALFITPQGWACQSYINFKAITSNYYSNPIDACYEMIIRLNELKML